MSIKDITVIIATFKSREIIKTCLNSIDKRVKIILIENSNDIEVKNEIEKEFSNVECLIAGENLGYGKSNNMGLKKVKTKYALILNPDATLYPSTLENFLIEAKKIPEFAIIGPAPEEKINNFENSNPKESVNVKGFAMFLNMIQFKNIGFFDENFFFYFEEIDLCRRLIEKGKKIYITPNIKVNHGGSHSHDKSINDQMELSRNWHWMWSTFNYHKKYRGFVMSFFIILPKLSSSIVKVLIYSLLFNKKKKEIYHHRLSGIINAIMGKSSWYRPKV